MNQVNSVAQSLKTRTRPTFFYGTCCLTGGDGSLKGFLAQNVAMMSLKPTMISGLQKMAEFAHHVIVIGLFPWVGW